MRHLFSLLFFGASLLASAQTAQIPPIGNFNKKIGDKSVSLYHLRNGKGMEMAVTNYGGRIVSLIVPDAQGKPTDVVSGYSSIDGYLNAPEEYFGALIGRYGNRIAKGKFKLDGTEYTLATNNAPNHLHGGPGGFHKAVWDAHQPNPRTLELTYTSPDGEEGYPGTVTAKVTYQITESNALQITYDATTDKPTIINLTNHAYFNLSGEGAPTINDHLLEIMASRYTPVDNTLIPTGELAPVAGTPFDFRQPAAIGSRLGQTNEQLKSGLGYDHNFVLDKTYPGHRDLAAAAFSATTGIRMDVYTTEPGIQFYGGNFLTGQHKGKSGRAYAHRSLFCLETQHFPDSPNQPDFPSCTLRPGDRYGQTTLYVFSAAGRLEPQVATPEPSSSEESRIQWSVAQANNWYNRQPWFAGANYIPAYAINQLEMWQAETFDTVAIERELQWARGMGMNTMRVFLHDLLWQQDAEGYRKRIDTFLGICARNRIRPILVLFDSCWNPDAQLGKQPDPKPGVHNSGWLKSPALRHLQDARHVSRLEKYVKDVITEFRYDPRILAWDLWNEPDNLDDRRSTDGTAHFRDYVRVLLPQVFDWARSTGTIHPLTSGVWYGDNWGTLNKCNAIQQIQLRESDIISFHCYGDSARFAYCIAELEKYGRPLFCTEYLARSMGSTFEKFLPTGKQHRVAMINWGLVLGKTQTNLPWDSWQNPYIDRQPPVWHHDVYLPNGQPYNKAEWTYYRNMVRGQ